MYSPLALAKQPVLRKFKGLDIVFNRSLRRSFRHHLLASVALSAVGVTPCLAQDSSAAATAPTVEKVVVTGSRLKKRDYSTTSPVTTIGAQTFELTQTTSVERLLNDLPQLVPGNTFTSNNAGGEDFATIDLRGLGANRTLVLVNGNRLPMSSTTGVVDINTIPAGLIDRVESFRGSLAGWALVVFGTVYAAWGLRQALRHRAGVALHSHGGHVHLHTHADDGHGHVHDDPSQKTVTFWTLFVVFVLGPCEPLIPLFMIPASRGRWSLALWTGVVFAVVTIATMLVIVGAAYSGLARLRWSSLERWSHSLAGGVIATTGLAVLFAGL